MSLAGRAQCFMHSTKVRMYRWSGKLMIPLIEAVYQRRQYFLKQQIDSVSETTWQFAPTQRPTANTHTFHCNSPEMTEPEATQRSRLGVGLQLLMFYQVPLEVLIAGKCASQFGLSLKINHQLPFSENHRPFSPLWFINTQMEYWRLVNVYRRRYFQFIIIFWR